MIVVAHLPLENSTLAALVRPPGPSRSLWLKVASHAASRGCSRHNCGPLNGGLPDHFSAKWQLASAGSRAHPRISEGFVLK